jgi:glycosyltransferase involved in cell wall biosynthesis
MTSRPQIHQFVGSIEFGGGEAIALNLARDSDRASDMQAHVWVPGEGRTSNQVRALGLPIHLYNSNAGFSGSRIRAAAANLSVAVRLRTMGRGLIHVHSPYVYAAFRYGLRVAGLKRVLHIHLDYELESLRWALQMPPELIVTCAQSLVHLVREALPAASRENQRIEAVPNAVDLNRFSPMEKTAAKRRLNAPLDKLLVLVMANLSPHKGQETAVHTIAALLKRGNPVHLWLAGADRTQEQAFDAKLRRLVEDLCLQDSVSFLGFRADSSALLQAADVVLLPSTSEGLPLTLLEAQACNVPVIAAPTAGVPEIVHDGETGFLVPAGDVEGYVNKIDLLFNNPATVRRITEQAAARCRTFHSWDAYRRRIAKLYSEVLAG